MPVNTRTTGCLKKTTSVQSPSSGINEGNELITSTETGGTVEQPGKGTEGIGFGKARIESLTDGIFAFGMTLLVLGAGYPFAVETLANRPVSQILLSSIPDIILYVISIFVPLRMDEATLKVGDDAVHGETAYAIGTEGE